MTRYWFGKSVEHWSKASGTEATQFLTAEGSTVTGVVFSAGSTAAELSLTEGGPAETDLLDANGIAVTEIRTTADGYLPRFQGPDEVRVMWVSTDARATWHQIVSSDAVAAAADWVNPLVLIEAAESVPPVGTPAGTLVYRKQA